MSSLIATASPDGRVLVQAGFPVDDGVIEFLEDAHRALQIDGPIEEAERRWQNQVARLTNAADADFELGELESACVSSRMAVIGELGTYTRRNNRLWSSRSRSHELHKSRLRLERRGR
ncbi:MAG: hypothetical protein AAB554_00800 [Patescibacteria group bacterium]